MKKIGIVLCMFLILVTPFEARAQETLEDKFAIEISDNVTSKKDVNGSGIYAGNNVNFDKKIEGIGMLFGNSVNYKGIGDYALLAGNNVNVDGTILNDGFIFGNYIDFSENFKSNRDLIIFGNSVNLQGEITRDIIIYAASVNVANAKINGNITIYAGTVEVKDTVEVKGALSYNKDASASIDTKAKINETKLLDNLIKEVTFKDRVITFVMDYAGMLVIFLALALIVPALFKRIENKTKEFNLFQLLVMIGIGALGLIIVPIIFLLLCSLIFGIPLAILILVLYIIIICLSTIFSGYVIGNYIAKKLIKKEISPLLIGLIGITIIMVLTNIPFVNTFVGILSLLLGIGTIGYLFKKD